MFSALINDCKNFINHVKNQIKKLTKPATAAIALGALSDQPPSRTDNLAEIAMLRQQLVVLKRSVNRPICITGVRVRLSFLACLTRFWKLALHIVQSENVLRWHRDIYRWYWRRKKCINQVRKRRSDQTWPSFLKNHAHQIWACDFTVVNDLLFRPLYIFMIIAHKTRLIIHFAVTLHSTNNWVAQQLREATPWDRRPRYLIQDNDNRPHQGIQQWSPGKHKKKLPPLSNQVKGKVISTPILPGLHHSYAYAGTL